ncbi:hypothetical protein SCB49_05627 [unidentified eubacterium SCB49]|nr:hypothetical protein SCB49_05627 [unidentified eubacterium SCB49]
MLLKKTLLLTGLFILTFCITYGLHFKILEWTNAAPLQYSLINMYIFHAIFSAVICIACTLIANLSSSYKNQIGFIYVFSMVFKASFFGMLFNDILFSDLVLNNIDNISLLIPLFIFLTIEVVIISKILNAITFK